MTALPLKEMIDICEANLSLMPEPHRTFINDMIKKKQQYGDSFFVSKKQMGYLYRCLSAYCPNPAKNKAPVSRLEELKAKRDKLLKSSAQRAHQERIHEMQSNQAIGAIRLGLVEVNDSGDARIVHDKNAKRMERQLRKTIKTVTDK